MRFYWKCAAAIAACLAVSGFSLKDDKLVVTFAGDYGANLNTSYVLKRIANINPELHFAMGDFSYSQLSEEDWCGFVRMALPTTPFLLVPGNHESDGYDGHISKFAACMPYTYKSPLGGSYPSEYYVDVPAKNPVARFIAIAPNLDFSDTMRVEFQNNNTHAVWLDNAIKEGREKGARWTIVIMHKVCMTMEKKDCEIGESLVKQLINARVDVVIAGHVHAYERTYPLTCVSPKTYNPACMISGAGPYKQGAGTTFITAGTGGINIRQLNLNDSEAPYFAKGLGYAEGSHFGVAKLTISHDELLEEFVEAREGKVLDSFVIKR